MPLRPLLIALVILGSGGLVSPAPASAQSAEAPRVFVDVNGAGQFTGPTQSTTLPFTIYFETANVVVKRPLERGRLIDVIGGVRVWNRFSLAMGISTLTTKARGTYTAAIPDPTYYDRPRTASGDVADMGHSERQIAVLIVYGVPIGRRFRLRLMAGPTQTRLEHDNAESATVIETESGPTVSLGLKRIVRTVSGYAAGLDFTYWPMAHAGIGSFVRVAHARAELGGATIVLGGVVAGVGLRLQF